MTLGQIGVKDSMIRPNSMMVQAFDVTKTSACWEIDLKLLIGPCKFVVSFVVVDILTDCNLLANHGYIQGGHSLQFTPKGQIYIRKQTYNCHGQGILPIPASTIVPFIDTQWMDSTSKYHSFKFISINYLAKGRVFLEAKFPNSELMIDSYLMKR